MVGPFLTLIHLLLQTIIIILPVSIDSTKEYIFIWTDLLKFSSDRDPYAPGMEIFLGFFHFILPYIIFAGTGNRENICYSSCIFTLRKTKINKKYDSGYLSQRLFKYVVET